MTDSPLMNKIKELQNKKKRQEKPKNKIVEDDWFMLDEIEDMEELGF